MRSERIKCVMHLDVFCSRYVFELVLLDLAACERAAKKFHVKKDLQKQLLEDSLRKNVLQSSCV